MDNITNYYIMTNSTTGQPGVDDAQGGYIVLAILGAVILIILVSIAVLAIKDLSPTFRFPRPRMLRRIRK